MAMHRRPIDEWVEIGSGLKKLNDEVAEMSVTVGKRGYLKHGDRLARLREQLGKIRSDLENQMLKEYRSAGKDIFF